jgi:DNA-binding CsgD family transcriptional regulator
MPDWLGEVVKGEGDLQRARASLLALAERLHGVGGWAWDTGSDRLAWSEGTRRILGALPNVTGLQEALERAHPDDRARLAGALRRARRGEPPAEIDCRIVSPSGSVRFLQALLAGVLARDRDRVLYGLLRDLTPSQSLERELAAHAAVSSVLGGWEGLEPDGARLLGSLSEALGFDQATLWVSAGDGLEPRLWWAKGDARPLRRWLEGRRIARGEGLAGAAWERRVPTVLPIGGASASVTLDYLRRQGSRGAVALPLIAAGRVLAVITMIGPDELQLTDRLRGALAAIGHEIGASLAPLAGELIGSPLTARERELLQLAADGLSGPQIARRLNLSPATVKTHFENIYAKYAVSDRVAAVAKAMRAGLIS